MYICIFYFQIVISHKSIYYMPKVNSEESNCHLSGIYLRLAKGLHVRAVTSPDQGRGWCSGDIALNLHVVSDSRGYVIHLEGFVQRYHRYTCHQIRIAFIGITYAYILCIWAKLNRIRAMRRCTNFA